jgi:hypothetical protein
MYSSNTSFWLSNTNNPVLTGVAEFGSNTSSWLSNISIPITSNIAVYGSNTSYWLSNTAIVWSSNTAVSASNKAFATWSNSSSNVFVGNGSNVGIGTTSPAYQLDVAGDINCTGTVRSNGIELTKLPTFSVWSSVTQSIQNSVTTKITFNQVHFNVGSGYITSSNAFYAPISGYYQMNGMVSFSTMPSNSGSTIIILYKNGSEVQRGSRIPTSTTGAAVNVSCVLSLAANDKLELYLIQSSGTTAVTENTSEYGCLLNGICVRPL